MSVEGALKEFVEVNLKKKTGKVDVIYDESKVTLEAIKEAVEEQGYDVVV